MTKSEKGIRATFWIPNDLNEQVEKLRNELALKPGEFYRFALIKLLYEYKTKTSVGGN